MQAAGTCLSSLLSINCNGFKFKVIGAERREAIVIVVVGAEPEDYGLIPEGGGGWTALRNCCNTGRRVVSGVWWWWWSIVRVETDM